MIAFKSYENLFDVAPKRSCFTDLVNFDAATWNQHELRNGEYRLATVLNIPLKIVHLFITLNIPFINTNKLLWW